MRIIVVSDTHRNFVSFEKTVQRHPEADCFIHLGDGAGEAERMRERYPEQKILSVYGNCDIPYHHSDEWDAAGVLQIGNIKIFYTHGHLYSVKIDLQPLIDAAAQEHADIALFGHTHIPLVTYRDGLHIMNPGSLGEPRGRAPSYGVIDIIDGNIHCQINKLEMD